MIIRLAFFTLLALVALVTASMYAAIESLVPPHWTHAHGVASSCGFYDIVVAFSDGTVQVFHGENPIPVELMAEVLEAPQEQRTMTVVPCPDPSPGFSASE